MSTILYKGCSNCGSKDFYIMGTQENRDHQVVLFAGRKIDEGHYEPINDQYFFVTPFICKECNHITFYKTT
ncbi:RNase P subunit RPR2 [Cytobacillus horneckiae]|uniref:hypothetical protein n=1 Tax=Cytobacillus horneckiae TaxID=549687 RepID=UPI0019D12390|nr:hypothetical protein [Cytobacillus horneckiae]MBN6890062.1 hypothetical protein [Cytobacillus horneckiae]